MAGLTMEKAKQLRRGDHIHYRSNSYIANNSKCEIWRVNGKVKLWKLDPYRIEVPIKHGLYHYGYVHEDTVAHFQLESECVFCRKEER